MSFDIRPPVPDVQIIPETVDEHRLQYDTTVTLSSPVPAPSAQIWLFMVMPGIAAVEVTSAYSAILTVGKLFDPLRVAGELRTILLKLFAENAIDSRTGLFVRLPRGYPEIPTDWLPAWAQPPAAAQPASEDSGAQAIPLAQFLQGLLNPAAPGPKPRPTKRITKRTRPD